MIFIIFITIIIAAFIIHKFHYNTNTIVVVVVIALAIMGFSWYISSTEKGKRVVKDFTSNVSGGIPRQVKVYNINGELIEEYEGTFDIETNHPYQYTSVTSFCSTIILFAVCSSAWLKNFFIVVLKV